ncbi:MAG: helix-turn-helix domain-containing protein [Pirellulales bacterium]|nr:helix-turn-helix domain-containing protein [Pirellulales bacterium]
MKTAQTITLTKEERATLTVWLRLHPSTRLALRAKIVLLAADGNTNQEIAERLRASRKTVSLWRRRFREGRLAGIEKEAPRSSARKAKARERMVRLILHKTMKERPADASHWTIRSLAKELGISPSMVHRVWKANDLGSRQE